MAMLWQNPVGREVWFAYLVRDVDGLTGEIWKGDGLDAKLEDWWVSMVRIGGEGERREGVKWQAALDWRRKVVAYLSAVCFEAGLLVVD